MAKSRHKFYPDSWGRKMGPAPLVREIADSPGKVMHIGRIKLEAVMD